MLKKYSIAFIIVAVSSLLIIFGLFVFKYISPGKEPMIVVPHHPCDVDFDRDCELTITRL